MTTASDAHERAVIAAPRWIAPLLALGTFIATPSMLGVVLMLSYDRPIAAATGAYALRGALPWSDAFDYWSAAQHLMQNGVLDEWGSRRPLNGAFLAARLGAAGDRASIALLMQSLLLAMALSGLVAVVAARTGWLSGVIVAALLVAAASIVQPTLQSEGLGLILGASGMALLVTAAATRRRAEAVRDSVPERDRVFDESRRRSAPDNVDAGLWPGVLGVALLSLGMAARPGAIFVLPAIGAWIVWRHRARWVRAAIIVLIALAAGTLADRAARSMYAHPDAAGNANFATTVLGLARGTDYYEADRWLRDAHPGVTSAAEHAREAYAESWRLLRTSPLTFIGSLARNEARFITRAWPLLLLVAIALVRSPRDERGLWIFGWLGMLASVPIIYGDGGIRVLAVTWPFAIVSAALAVRSHATVARRCGTDAAWIAAAAGFVAISMAVAGPAIERRLGWFDSIPRPNAVKVDDMPREGTDEVDWVRGFPALHVLLVVGPDDGADVRSTSRVASHANWVTLEALMREPAIVEFAEPLDRVPTPFLLCVVYDINQSRARVFTVPVDEQTDRALLGRESGFSDPIAPPRVLRIDSNPLRSGGRVRVGRFVEPAR